MTRAVRTALLLLCLASPSLASAEVLRAHDAASLAAAAGRAQPGDTVTLANGTWRDVALVVDARGTMERPITIAAETAGGVIVSGRSSLRITGAHLMVSGLVFRDGHAPGSAVIETAANTRGLRLTDLVIDRYNKPDRRTADVWIRLAGEGHRIDTSWLVGKGNAGTVVEATGAHRIEHNYFGPRAPLGGPGGETIRGKGGVTIAGNLFDRCDGGVAIVDLTGDGGIFRQNAVLRSQGEILLRGTGLVAERNVIRGTAKRHTGGFRVAGGDAVVRANYVDRVAGSAVAVDTPERAIVENNSIIDSARVTLDRGSVRFDRNLLRNTLDPIRVGGARVSFTGNVSSFDPPAIAAHGMMRDKHDFLAAPGGLLHLPTAPGVGAPAALSPLVPTTVGPKWYPKAVPDVVFARGVEETIVQPGTLAAAVAAAQPSAILALQPGDYRLDAPLVIDRPLTIRGTTDVRLSFAGTTAFQLAAGGSLHLDTLAISGRVAPRRAGNAVVRAPLRPSTQNYTVMLDHVTVADLERSSAFDVVATMPGTLAERIDLRGVTARGVSGALVAAAAEVDGRYSAEQLRITDARLTDVRTVADVAGGTAESGFGPAIEVTDMQVTGGGSPALRLTNVATATIAHNRFDRAGTIDVTAHGASPVIRCNRFTATPPPRAGSGVVFEPDEQAPRCIAHRIALGDEP